MQLLQTSAELQKYRGSVPLEEKREQILADLESVRDIFTQSQAWGLLSQRFRRGQQWSEEEIEDHHRQKRQPYAMNEIMQKVEHVAGAQVSTRLDIKISPRSKSESRAANLLTYLVKWAEQENDLEFTESNVFIDMLVKAVGCVRIGWDIKNMRYGYPVIEKISFNEMFWDASAQKLDLTDARWMAHIPRWDRLKLLETFPEWEEAIMTAPSVVTPYYSDNNYMGIPSPRQQMIQATDSFRSRNSMRDIVEVIEYYESIVVPKYIVEDNIAGSQERFDTQKEADERVAGIIDGYMEYGIDLLNPDGSQKVVAVGVKQTEIHQTILIGGEVVYSKPTSLPVFPYVVGFGYFDDGDYWGFVEQLIDPQMFLNRMFSQWDHQVATSSKNGVTVIEAMLRPGYTIEKLRLELAAPGAVVSVKNHNAVQPIRRDAINPELMQGITYAIDTMNRFAGGPNALGLQENAAESGKAVIARQNAAGTSRIPIFDHLRFWRKQVTDLLVHYIKNYMPAEQILDIVGTDDMVEFQNIDDGLLDTLQEIEVKVSITEVPKNDSVREQQFLQTLQYMREMNVPIEHAMPVLIELMDIPEALKEKLMDSMEEMKRIRDEQAAEAHQKKLEQQVQDSVQKEKMREQMLMASEMEMQGRVSEEKVKAEQIRQQIADEFQQNLDMHTQHLDPVNRQKMQQAGMAVMNGRTS